MFSFRIRSATLLGMAALSLFACEEMPWAVAGRLSAADWQVGTNIANHGYDYASPQFANMLMQASPFYYRQDPASSPGHDAQGYPLWADASHTWYSIIGLNYYWPAGKYTIIADGVGTLRLYGFNSGAKLKNPATGGLLNFNGSGQAQTVECVAGRGASMGDFAWLEIIYSRADNRLRNIRVYPPGVSPNGGLFHPDFLNGVRRYAALRFVDWGLTNGNPPLVRWSDRPTPGTRVEYSQLKPYEYMFDLCNALDRDCWLCIPHVANDDFIRNLAALANNRLEPARTLYVEYSCETWNWTFPQFAYFQEWSRANGNPGAWQAAGYLSGRALDIFKKATSPNRKLVRVLGGQIGWPENLFVQYEVLKGSGFDVDALAVAPYMLATPINQGDVNYEAQAMDAWNRGNAEGAMTLLFQGMRAYLDGVMNAVGRVKAYADQKGKVLLFYECGQHLTTGGGGWPGAEAMEAMYTYANRHDGMRVLYGDYFTRLTSSGVKLLLHYYDAGQYGRWGAWGAKEYYGQPDSTAPKYVALQPFLSEPAVPPFLGGIVDQLLDGVGGLLNGLLGGGNP